MLHLVQMLLLVHAGLNFLLCKKKCCAKNAFPDFVCVPLYLLCNKNWGHVTSKVKVKRFQGVFNVAKYDLGKVKLELMQPASMPFQPISFRQAKHELMQPVVSLLGNMWLVGRPSRVLQGFMVQCIIVVVYSAVSRQNFPIYISSDYIMKEMIIHSINNNYKTKCKRSCCLGN